jgi:hypothetical protein
MLRVGDASSLGGQPLSLVQGPSEGWMGDLVRKSEGSHLTDPKGEKAPDFPSLLSPDHHACFRPHQVPRRLQGHP